MLMRTHELPIAANNIMSSITDYYTADGQWHVYQQLDYHNNVERSTGDDQLGIIHNTYGTLSALSTIEQFVRASVNSTYLPVFSDHSNDNSTETTKRRLANYYTSLNIMTGAYDERYFYSPRVDAFFQACRELGLTTGFSSFGKNPLENDFGTGQCYLDVYHALIIRIRELCSTPKFRRKLREHERSVRRREAKALMWEKKLFEWRSRHLIIPLTLEYRPQFREQVTPELIQEHLQHLLGNKRSNALLSGIKHYVWRIEEGDKTGLHVHLLIAYRGDSHQDMSISRSICDYWETVVTEGMGYARSSSMYKGSRTLRTYGACAGQIDHHEYEKRQLLRGSLRYLVKSDQFLKRKAGRKFRTFGMSQPPERSGIGRPRVKSHGR